MLCVSESSRNIALDLALSFCPRRSKAYVARKFLRGLTSCQSCKRSVSVESGVDVKEEKRTLIWRWKKAYFKAEIRTCVAPNVANIALLF